MRYHVVYTEAEDVRDIFRTSNWEDALEAFEDFATQVEAFKHFGSNFTNYEWCAEREADGKSIAAVVLNDYAELGER